MSPSECQACRGDWPNAALFIGDCGASRAYLFDDQFFRGWTVLVLKAHATELFTLSPNIRAQLMDEVSAVAQSLAMVYAARKINYELLGNQLPHIHWHLIPRCQDDPAPLEPVWRVPHEAMHLALDDSAREIARIQEHLAGHLPGFISAEALR